MEPVYDAAGGHYYALSRAQVAALMALPVLVASREAPPLGTLRALQRRGIVVVRGRARVGHAVWIRTPLGERLAGALIERDRAAAS